MLFANIFKNFSQFQFWQVLGCHTKGISSGVLTKRPCKNIFHIQVSLFTFLQHRP